MCQKLNLNFPDISETLYNARSSEDIWNYSNVLRKTDNIYNCQYANKLDLCKNMLKESSLKQLEQEFYDFKYHMRPWSKKSGIRLSLSRRQKDFLGLNAKIRLFLSSGRILSKINDFLGFRIVVCTPQKDSETSINHCFEVLNETIRFFTIKKQCVLFEAEPRNGKEINHSEAKKRGIIIPKKNLVIPGFENHVKDYVSHPKEKTGYQSFHLLLQMPNGLVFEVQIRTFAMDILESHNHLEYKNSRYTNPYFENLDLTKIQIPGFSVLENGEIFDMIGLKEAIDPFNFLH